MSALRIAAALAAALLVTACQRAGDEKVDTVRFPGQVTTGGGTSGAVMRAAKPMGEAMREGGTPGIPQGAGGNTAGASMGGTTGSGALANTGEQSAAQQAPGNPAPSHGAASAGAAPGASGSAAPADGAASSVTGAPSVSGATGASAPTGAASVPAGEVAAREAARQKQLLDESMTRIAQHWRERAAREGWTTQPATAEGGVR